LCKAAVKVQSMGRGSIGCHHPDSVSSRGTCVTTHAWVIQPVALRIRESHKTVETKING